LWSIGTNLNRIGHIDYNLHQPLTISIIPPEPVIAKWKADYEIMLEQMIYDENAPSFDKLIKRVEAIERQDKFAGLDILS